MPPLFSRLKDPIVFVCVTTVLNCRTRECKVAELILFGEFTVFISRSVCVFVRYCHVSWSSLRLCLFIIALHCLHTHVQTHTRYSPPGAAMEADSWVNSSGTPFRHNNDNLTKFCTPDNGRRQPLNPPRSTFQRLDCYRLETFSKAFWVLFLWSSTCVCIRSMLTVWIGAFFRAPDCE